MVPGLWSINAEINDAAFSVVQNNPEKWQAAIGAMIASGVNNVVEPAFNCFGFSAIWQVLAQALDDAKKVKPHELLPWLEYAMNDKDTLVNVLAGKHISMLHSLVTIARMTTPDSIPNEYGQDPWVLATQGAEGEVDESEQIYLMSYLLSRALGLTSCCCAELATISFDLVYHATMINSIDEDAWELLDNRLPHAGWWDSWDRCRRLRQAVAELFLNRDLPAGMFGLLSQDDLVFAEIASAEAQLYKGKRYLKKVRQEMSNNNQQEFSERIHVVDKLLG
jgi:hypothetical protein